MNITEQREGEVAIIKPQGLLTGSDADTLKSRLAAVLDDPGRVVLDASEIAFADSRGLEVLVEATERLIRSGQALKLAGVNETLREALELTELATLFEQYEDVEAAVGSF